MRKVPEVAIEGVDLGGGCLHRNVVCGGVGDSVLAGANVPRSPGSDNGEVRRQRLVGQFEADLIVALAGATVGDRVGAFEEGDLNLVLGDDRARHRRAQQVFPLVDCPGTQGRKDVLAQELLAGVDDIGLGSAAGEGLGFDLGEVVGLADVDRGGDDLAVAILFPQPGDDAGGIETSGVGEDDFSRRVAGGR
jgi:hypothetical protein